MRDALLGRPVNDLDARRRSATAIRIARAPTPRRRRRAWCASDENGSRRCGSSTRAARIDLWDLEGSGLEADLGRRDFTINAMALDRRKRRAGRSDRRPRRSRRDAFCARPGPRSFAEDPLRVLRLVRLALALPELAIDPATIDAARNAVSRLSDVAQERVRDELDRILGARALRSAASWFDELGLAPILFDERHGPALGSSSRSDDIRSRIGRSRTQAGLTTIDWRSTGRLSRRPPVTVARLRISSCSGRCSDGVSIEQQPRLRLGLLASAVLPEAAVAARRLWLHGAGPAWQAALALGAAFSSSAAERSGWEELADWARSLPAAERAQVLEPEPLLDGLDMQRILEIEPGPEIGVALAAIEREQVAGRISDRAGAEQFLRERNVRRELD